VGFLDEHLLNKKMISRILSLKNTAATILFMALAAV